jgi:hypothetical protein
MTTVVVVLLLLAAFIAASVIGSRGDLPDETPPCVYNLARSAQPAELDLS